MILLSSSCPQNSTTYRLALLLPQRQALLAEANAPGWRLPRISVPTDKRRASAIQSAIAERWSLKGIVLDTPTPTAKELEPLAIVEIRGFEHQLEACSLASISVKQLKEAEISNQEQLQISRLFSGTLPLQQPFLRLGWIEEAIDWIGARLALPSADLTENIVQLKASPTFALVRFSSADGASYWMKATGDPQRQELLFTKTLADLWPEYLPDIIATREDWNAWLMKDAGETLSLNWSLDACGRAIAVLASLQIKSILQLGLLEGRGFPNTHLPVSSRLDELFSYLEFAMTQQQTTKAPVLTPTRLKELREFTKEASAEMQALQLPRTLIHGDINPGNIFPQDNGCLFTDWAEAGIGNPLITCELLLTHIAKRGGAPLLWRDHLLSIYRDHWRKELSTDVIDRGLTLSTVLAVLSCLNEADTSLPPEAVNPGTLAYHRSLARHLDRAVRSMELARAS